MALPSGVHVRESSPGPVQGSSSLSSTSAPGSSKAGPVQGSSSAPTSTSTPGSSKSAPVRGSSSSAPTSVRVQGSSVQATSLAPLVSDEEEDDDATTFGHFPLHLEFIKMIKEAQEKAEKTQERAYYEWRGYKSSVFPSVPKFKKKQLKERLAQALRGISNITEEEKRVIFTISVYKLC